MKFTDAFWGPSSDPTQGLLRLHQNLVRDVEQVEELIVTLQTRISVEESYAAKLYKAKESLSEPVSLVASILDAYNSELKLVSVAHKSLADGLAKMVPLLQRFVDDAKKFVIPQKDAIVLAANRLGTASADVSLQRSLYRTKAKAALEAEPASPQIDIFHIMVSFGSVSFTVDDFNDFLLKMQQAIESKELRFLLGSYKDCYFGGELIGFARQRLGLDEAKGVEFMTELVSQGYLKPLSGRVPVFVSNSYYQWKRTVLEMENEPVHKKLKREADKQEYEYKKSIKLAESLRLSFDALATEYMFVVQSLMLQRVKMIKSTLANSIDAEGLPSLAVKSLTDRVSVFLETLDAEKEVQLVLERDRGGSKPLATHVFDSIVTGPTDAVFGIDLQHYSGSINKRIPPQLRSCLLYLEDVFVPASLSPMDIKSDELDIWIEPSFDLPPVHVLRGVLSSGKYSRKTLRKYPVEVIVGVVKLYLSELPDSLCPDDLYSPLKLLYLSKSEDVGSMRLSSLRSLLATLPSSHFHTLSVLVKHWIRMFSPLSNQHPRLTDFCNAVGPLILRPMAESPLTFHDKHPARLLRDLLLNFVDIIPKDILSPANSSDLLAVEPTDGSDVDSELDEAASMRALYDPPSKRRPSVTSINSFSAFSAFTKRTGYSRTIGTTHTDDSVSVVSVPGTVQTAIVHDDSHGWIHAEHGRSGLGQYSLRAPSILSNGSVADSTLSRDVVPESSRRPLFHSNDER